MSGYSRLAASSAITVWLEVFAAQPGLWISRSGKPPQQ
jgi:hypothetical protein